jgi:hypothetical protein
MDTTHEDGFPTTLYRAIRRPDGRHVCIDVDYLRETTKVVQTRSDWSLAKSLGWYEHPVAAMEALDREEEQLSTDAGVRNFDDRRLTDAAKLEAEEAERHTIRHLPDVTIPVKRGPGRPKKVV